MCKDSNTFSHIFMWELELDHAVQSMCQKPVQRDKKSKDLLKPLNVTSLVEGWIISEFKFAYCDILSDK